MITKVISRDYALDTRDFLHNIEAPLLFNATCREKCFEISSTLLSNYLFYWCKHYPKIKSYHLT